MGNPVSCRMITDVPEQYRVRLNQLGEHELNQPFVAFRGQYVMLHLYRLEQGVFAVEVVSVGKAINESPIHRYLTQTEVDSLHFEVRSHDGIKALRVQLES